MLMILAKRLLNLKLGPTCILVSKFVDISIRIAERRERNRKQLTMFYLSERYYFSVLLFNQWPIAANSCA